MKTNAAIATRILRALNNSKALSSTAELATAAGLPYSITAEALRHLHVVGRVFRLKGKATDRRWFTASFQR